MEYKELGDTGVMVSEIGLGTWKYRGGPQPLQRGVALGANLIDTAEMYHTEDAVGQAIRGIRGDVFLATKVLASHLAYDDLLRAAENSLRQLEQEVIDLYQIHWPSRNVPITETMRAMEELVDRGLVRHIGVSNFSLAQLQEAQRAMSKNPVVSNQVYYNLSNRRIERDLVPYCVDNKITVIAYTPLADGSLAGSSRFSLRGRPKVLEQVAQENDKTQAQVALNWCVSRAPVIAIPKTNGVARTEENCAASGWRLSSDHLRRLEEAFPL